LAILGYKPVITVAEATGLADEVRSMEHGPLARFFIPQGEIAAEWQDYFTSFHLVISFLSDPDDIFHGNLRRIGVPTILLGPAKIEEPGGHAIDQLASVLSQLAIFPEGEDRALRLEFKESWRLQAEAFLGPTAGGEGVKNRL
jgi:hypothetical protein